MIFRDLSTFELDFSKRDRKQIFSHIDGMNMDIVEFQEEFKLQHASKEVVRGWLTESQINTLESNFIAL